jgi:acyl-CoA-binding protein
MRSKVTGGLLGFAISTRHFGFILYSVGKRARKITVYYPDTPNINNKGRSPPMSDLKTKFESAVANSKNLSERPDNMTLLKLYALYKQASAGDNTEKKPSFSDMVGRAKWDAWSVLKGTDSDTAMQQYIDLIESLS